ncbi:hypothetical protein MMC24_000295 [Lignoscripta atroalba]|nr:hypothetical protein [Lignoscripta atroalba]
MVTATASLTTDPTRSRIMGNHLLRKRKRRSPGQEAQAQAPAELARLIESTGHVGKVDDLTIKPIEQHSFLVTGFSRHASFQFSSGGRTMSAAVEAVSIRKDATRIRPQDGKAVDAGVLASQVGELSSSDDDGGLSDSDPD